VTYLFLYTPLKRLTPLSTILGGIPGALPPVMGWTAVRNELSNEALVLFAILFFWQMPHFFSLAWMYRKDYARAGYRMLTVLDNSGSRTSAAVLGCTTGLVLVSILPAIGGYVGTVYLMIAVLLGLCFLATGITLYFTRSNASARVVFFASLVYLPVLLLVMVIDRV
ncbi:MAG: protoheme IX farnesyltransferase, partial [Bacteroidota bacterium]